MTEAERHRLTLVHCREHAVEWDAYLARPWQDRAVDQQKVEATYHQRGVQAARDMMRALGMPMLPDELCDPVAELEVKRASATDREWLYGMMAQFCMSRVEVDELLDLEPHGRADH